MNIHFFSHWKVYLRAMVNNSDSGSQKHNVTEKITLLSLFVPFFWLLSRISGCNQYSSTYRGKMQKSMWEKPFYYMYHALSIERLFLGLYFPSGEFAFISPCLEI